MSHRMKRWTCCDNRDESTHMANGCRARRHMAVTLTAPYDEIERKAKAVYDAREEVVNKKLDELTKPDWPRQFMTHAKIQLTGMEEDLKAQRDVVARFKNIKFE
jgi:hypothetical protein